MTKKRLAALELAVEKSRETRRAARQAQIDRAHARLTRREREALRELQDAPQETLDAVNAVSRPYQMQPQTGAHGAFIQWSEQLEVEPDDQPLTPAPVGAVAQFEEWAALCWATLEHPECTGLLQTAYRWHAAGWAWDAALAREAGEADYSRSKRENSGGVA